MIRSDRPAKLQRLVGILGELEAESMALTSPESLAWLLDGARVSVPYGGMPVIAAVVHRTGELSLSAYSNEVDRLLSEEIDPQLPVRAVAWHDELLSPSPGRIDESQIAGRLRAARAPLLPLERERFTALGGELAAVVTEVLTRATPTTTERELAAELVRSVVAIGADPVVLLVAGEGRLGHRHPLPTGEPLGARAMVAVGARRHGLVASLTRWIAQSARPTAIDDALLEVEAEAFAATQPGRPLNEVLRAIADAYERHGLGADAWLGHHQGGPTGYAGRDPRATPRSDDRVQTGQAFAWNPTVAGGKVEDTVIIDEAGIHLLTIDPHWPVRLVHGIPRPLAVVYGDSEGRGKR